MRRRPHAPFALFLSAVIAVSGCAPAAPAPTTPPRVLPEVVTGPRVTGRVLDPGGKPFAGATVALVSPVDMFGPLPDSVTTSTDASGVFAFADVAAGHYSITATAPGFAAAYGGTIDVAAASITPTDVKLGGKGVRYTGRVTDERGPVAKARVSVVEYSPKDLSTYVTYADEDGRYTIDLAAGLPYFGFIAAPPRMRTFELFAPGGGAQDFVLEPAPVDRPSDTVIRAYLDAHAIPITTDDPAAPGDDLAPVLALVGDAPLVSIGEVTHGSREIFRVRHRLTAALLERTGGVFAVEAGYAECRAIEAYVQGGEGDPKKVIRGLVTDYLETEEWLALVEWMRAHNADKKKPRIHFEGFDVVTFTAVKVVVDAAKKVLPKRAAELEAALAPLSRYDADATFAEQPVEARDRVSAAITELRAAFKGSKEEVVLGHHLDVLEQGARVFVDPLRRDGAMADNVDWLVARYPKERIVLSMHDLHASKHGLLENQVGRLLSRRHGDQHVVIGTGFARGGFRSLGEDMSKGVGSFRVEAPQPGSLDEAMALATPAMFALDLRRAEGPVGAWLDGPMRATTVGFRFFDAAGAAVPTIPKRSYDVLLFVEEVTPARAF